MKKLERYILVNRKPVPEPDLLVWAAWFGVDDNRRVAYSSVGRSHVSTIFLGLDHNYGRKGPPILWETRIMSGKLKGTMWRCAGTWEQAEAMHQEAVDRLKGFLKPTPVKPRRKE